MKSIVSLWTEWMIFSKIILSTQGGMHPRRGRMPCPAWVAGVHGRMGAGPALQAAARRGAAPPRIPGSPRDHPPRKVSRLRLLPSVLRACQCRGCSFHLYIFAFYLYICIIVILHMYSYWLLPASTVPYGTPPRRQRARRRVCVAPVPAAVVVAV